jgi:hypothetical protein
VASNGGSAPERPALRVPGLTKLYAWSIVLDPLLFFQLFPQSVTGITGNASRLAQITVIAMLFARFCLTTGDRVGRMRFVPLTNPLYRNYTAYYALTVVAGIIGVVTGAYVVTGATNEVGTAAAKFIDSSATRPTVEYVIAAYYFVYFTILPQYFLRTNASLEYLFRTFRRMFYLCLVVGGLDLALIRAGIHVFPRALYDNTFVGFRFHGIAGEPRDAFVYMIFSLAVLHLDAFYHDERLDKRWIAVALTAALLTQSASGLIGLLLFGGLYIVYTLPRMRGLRILQLALVLTTVAVVVYEAILHTPRLAVYVEGASGIWSALESGATLPPVIALQFTNFFPLYDLYLKLRHLDWLPVIIGSGLGSASAANTHYIGASAELSNPASQLVRTLYEAGIIGTIIFIRAFTQPVMYLARALPPKRRNEFLVLTLALVGCFLAHRSSTAFIYVGVVIAVFRSLDQRETVPVHGGSHVPAPAPEPAAVV